MIWVRRISTVLLVIIYLILFVGALLIAEVDRTFANPDFYKNQLRQADISNFVLDEFLPAALDELQEDIDLTNIGEELVSAAREIVPPEWLQGQVEGASNAVASYLSGDTDSFAHTIAFQEKTGIATQVIKTQILQGNTSAKLYDDLISYAADRMLENLDRVPYSLTLTRAQLEDFLRSAAPQDWVSAQGVAAVDSITSYATGDSDHFTITTQFRDRIDSAAAAAREVLKGQETYDYLLDEIITPIVLKNIGTTVDLGYGVTLTREEIASAVEQVLPQSWIEARLGELIDAVAAYVKGEADTIEMTVNLADRKPAALATLTSLADQKLEAAFYSLPECSMEQFLQIVQTLPPDCAPPCRPCGVSYDAFITSMDINITDLVQHSVIDYLPDQWVYTQADLWQSLGEENTDFLEKAHDRAYGGWTFSDADLIDKLDSDQEQTFDDVHESTKDGYTVTEADLRDRIAQSDWNLRDFDTLRQRIDSIGNWLWAIWLLDIVILVLIAFLAGRTWISRAFWGLGVLFVSALVTFIALTVTYSVVLEPRLVVFNPSDYEGVSAVLAEKGNEIIINAVGAFFWGVEKTAIYFMIASSILILALIVWKLVLPRMRRTTLQ